MQDRCFFGALQTNSHGKQAGSLTPSDYWEASFWGTRGGVNEVVRVILHQETKSNGDVADSTDYFHRVSGTISQHLHNTSKSYDYRASSIDTNGNTATGLTYSWFFMKDTRIENHLAGAGEFGYTDDVVLSDIYGGSTKVTMHVIAQRCNLYAHSVKDQKVTHI